MFCNKCGNEMQDSEKFCGNCGAPVETSAVQPVEAPSAEPVVQAAQPQVKPLDAVKKLNPKILICAAAAVVVVLAIVLISGLGGDAAKVEKAFIKTFEAYADAADKFDMPDLTKLTESQKVSQTASVWIEEMDGSSDMEGIGVRMVIDSNIPGRKMGIGMTPFYAEADLCTVQVTIDDAEIAVGSPELTKGVFYVLNTETLGIDLDNLGAEMGELDTLSFNLFEIIELVEEGAQYDKDALKGYEKAVKDLVKAVKIDKTGKETIEVNENDVKCTAYQVVIPQDAMENVLSALEALTESVDNEQLVEDMYIAMGIPEDLVDDMMASVSYTASNKEAFNAMEDVLDILGDIELNVYLNKGYVMAIVYEGEIEGSDVEVTVNLGGNEEYVDDLSVTIVVDDDTQIALISTGNHAGKGGTFSDETVVEVSEGSYEATVLTSEFRYEPKKDDENIYWDLDASGIEISAAGLLTTKSSSMTLRLNELELSEYGDTLAVVGLEYSIDSYKNNAVKAESEVELADMSQDDLEDAVIDISENLNDWLEELIDQVPELEYMF